MVKEGTEIIEHLRKQQERDNECLEEQEDGEREEESGRKECGERHTAAAAAVETMRLDYKSGFTVDTAAAVAVAVAVRVAEGSVSITGPNATTAATAGMKEEDWKVAGYKPQT